MDNGRVTQSAIASMLVGRDLILDFLRIATRAGDPLDTVLMMAVINANVAPVSARPDLQLTYGGEDGVPPDWIRRPLPISGLARSLSLPFETVRRRISRLCAAGVCEMTSAGVVVPKRVLDTPEFTQAGYDNLVILRTAHGRLSALGLLPPAVEATGSSVTKEADGLRIAARLATDYFLRMVDALGQEVGDLIDGIILLQLSRENTRSLAADEHKRPATAAAVARELNLAPETVRRRIKRLVLEGRCSPIDGGYIIPQEHVASRFVELRAANEQNLLRLFRLLESFGISRGWAAAQPGRPDRRA
jgi:DNA-binding Lrp family transcriptional regulator